MKFLIVQLPAFSRPHPTFREKKQDDNIKIYLKTHFEDWTWTKLTKERVQMRA
jgi:hypothetical protein